MMLGALAIFYFEFSGFMYPEVAIVTPTLGDGTSAGGNAVIQSGALPFRQGRLKWDAQSTADMLTVRALSETKDLVTFTDSDGTEYSVMVFDFASTEVIPEEVWAISVTLVEVG